jgi:hypothetical protein
MSVKLEQQNLNPNTISFKDDIVKLFIQCRYFINKHPKFIATSTKAVAVLLNTLCFILAFSTNFAYLLVVLASLIIMFVSFLFDLSRSSNHVPNSKLSRKTLKHVFQTKQKAYIRQTSLLLVQTASNIIIIFLAHFLVFDLLNLSYTQGLFLAAGIILFPILSLLLTYVLKQLKLDNIVEKLYLKDIYLYTCKLINLEEAIAEKIFIYSYNYIKR